MKTFDVVDTKTGEVTLIIKIKLGVPVDLGAHVRIMGTL